MMTRADNECKVMESIVTCRTCKGRGVVEVLDESDPLGYHDSDTKQCPSCMGSGVLRRIEMLNVYYAPHLPSGRDKQNHFNHFDKPDEQSETCFSYAMARNGA